MAQGRHYGNNFTTSSRNRLSDRDMVVDLINTEKHLSHLYEHAIMESSNNTVHNAMEELQHDEHEAAYTLFNVMRERGWYNPEQVQRNISKKNFSMSSNKRKHGNQRNKSYNNQAYQYS